jgi:hypothetical protein
MFDDVPPWLKKALGGYLRRCLKWSDSSQLEKILEFYFGINPPPGEAETYAKAIAQRLCPMGRPRKEARRWEQLQIDLAKREN